MEHSKLIPVPTIETKPYWDACQQKKLSVQKCEACGHIQFYPRIMCTECSSRNVSWTEVSGEAKVITYTIVHRPILDAYKEEAPYILSILKLNEGPTMMTNIINCPLNEVHCGMKVEVTFKNWGEDFLVPVFEPRD